jgi:hypothetical protein
MHPTYIKDLMDSYIAGTATDAEWEQLAGWVAEATETDIASLLHDAWEAQPAQAIMPAGMEARIISKMFDDQLLKPRPETPKRWLWLWRPVAAAVLIIVLATTAYVLLNGRLEKSGTVTQKMALQDVQAPQINRARIMLANGRTFYLDTAASGTLIQQQQVSLKKNADGQIAYQGVAQNGSVIYNTLINPRGSKVIDMTLTDGSRVWLNAGSSLTYPIAFTANERQVTVNGEAYFEIAHNPSKPFIVRKGDLQVRVLGTHFNVNAYDDEQDIKITLLEGSVNVAQANENKVLAPGEQAIVDSVIHMLGNVNIEQVIAWKNGYFMLNKADIRTIMRQVARWYDVDIVYAQGVPKGTFSGEVPRTFNLSEVLKVYEYSGVHFEIEGRKIIVKP